MDSVQALSGGRGYGATMRDVAMRDVAMRDVAKRGDRSRVRLDLHPATTVGPNVGVPQGDEARARTASARAVGLEEHAKRWDARTGARLETNVRSGRRHVPSGWRRKIAVRRR